MIESNYQKFDQKNYATASGFINIWWCGSEGCLMILLMVNNEIFLNFLKKQKVSQRIYSSSVFCKHFYKFQSKITLKHNARLTWLPYIKISVKWKTTPFKMQNCKSVFSANSILFVIFTETLKATVKRSFASTDRITGNTSDPC